MFSQDSRDPATLNAFQLFAQVIVGCLVLLFAALFGFLIVPFGLGQSLRAIKDEWTIILTVVAVVIGFSLVSAGFWSLVFAHAGAPAWVMQSAKNGRKGWLIRQALIGLLAGLLSGYWYLSSHSAIH